VVLGFGWLAYGLPYPHTTQKRTTLLGDATRLVARFTSTALSQTFNLRTSSTKPTMFFQLLVVFTSLATAFSGPAAVALCYTACNAGYGTCLGLVGVTAGVTAPVTWAGWFYGVPAACAGCSLVQGTCMAACTPILLTPTP
jgi:hypothetical protein